MAKVMITVEGEPHEIRRTLRMLLGPGKAGHWRGQWGKGQDCGQRGWRGGREAEAGQERTPWKTEELTQLWSEVTANARTVLTEIAKRPNGYPNAELQQALKMPGNAIGGSLSSVGVVSRRFGPKPPVYKFRWDEYRMPPAVAELVRLLSQEQQGREPQG